MADIEVLVVALLILLVLWAMFASRYRRKMKSLSIFVIIVSVVAIVYATLVSRNESALAPELMPFASLLRAKEQPEVLRSMFMNIALFLPLGLALPFVFSKNDKRVLVSVLIGFALSLVIEFLQYAFSLGFAETDDILCNTLGVLIGCSAWYLTKWFCKLRYN